MVQLEAYAIAAVEVPFTSKRPNVIDVTFAYLGGGLATVSERADEAWIDRARHHLAELVASIDRGQWQPTASTACRHCDFARFCEAGTTWLEDNG
jgi:hypothetical protein